MKFKNTLFVSSAIALSCAVMFSACVEETSDQPEDSTPVEQPNDKDDQAIAGGVVKYGGEIFSIPSPIQTAMMIRRGNVPYNEKVMNSTESAESYKNQFKKALNLGVYGADLAYLANFNNSALCIDYFNVIDAMASDLGVASDIDPSLMTRFHENVDNQDSLLALNADLYKEINQYLKDNERNEAASLILAGGWIESLNISVDAAMQDSVIRQRIGEQQSALNSILALLAEDDDAQVVELRTSMMELKTIFDGMQREYVYVKPITDAGQKTTYINSKTNIVVTDEELQAIAKTVEQIRSFIIG